jgi:hypothetical protein
MLYDHLFEFPQLHVDDSFFAAQSCDRPPSFVYLFYSPDIKSYKIGRTKNAKSFNGRLQERVRQCGDTRVLALWRCHPDDAPTVEAELLEKAKPYRTGRETFHWYGDFIELYATFIMSADWKAYSMTVLWRSPLAMSGFKEASTTAEEFLKKTSLSR